MHVKYVDVILKGPAPLCQRRWISALYYNKVKVSKMHRLHKSWCVFLEAKKSWRMIISMQNKAWDDKCLRFTSHICLLLYSEICFASVTLEIYNLKLETLQVLVALWYITRSLDVYIDTNKHIYIYIYISKSETIVTTFLKNI